MVEKHNAIASTVMGACLALTQPVLAQTSEPIGALAASIDGTSYRGETLSVPSEGSATASFQSFGPVTKVTIQAHDPEAESRMHNVLALEVSLMGDRASASQMDKTVSWWPEGMNAPFYISEGNEAEVQVIFDTLSFADGASAATGSFSALLCRKQAFFSEADRDDCKQVEGTFDTRLSQGT
ncbi:hypothetical protein HTT03_13840 [Sulfitobacter sp. S0837]|uniref:hypothetical protein n=1 Tax=Sulfitobacter maritimus TaxID=2741719 RepID=UPI001584201F|nr:hypothetical protein [Sulfitobacter maritimus]NUH66364.1 hypothetical protein [Sulfitobacter maritimus]